MLDDEEDRKGRLTLGQRVGLLERWQETHAKSITELTNVIGLLEKEVAQLTEWKLDQMLMEAREEERDKTLQERLLRIEKSIEDGVGSIKSAFSKAFWIAAGTIIPAAVVGIALMIVFGIKLAFLTGTP